MIAEAGHFALILALAVALILSIVPLAGAFFGRTAWMQTALPASRALFFLVSLALVALIASYALSDFSVENVARNSHALKPLFYKLTAAWSNHEGSMLLWLWVLTFFGWRAGRAGGFPDDAFCARALGVQGLLALVFILYILSVSNPFLRLDPPPLTGAGLNPVLQDPALALHPPFLYLGYVGFSLVFSFAAAALMGGDCGPSFAVLIRRWVLLAWSMLTIGIALGSFWAYYELGWGGFWFWDPVENASLMPWLCGTMLLHANAALARRGVFPVWVLLLCVLSFGFSLTGTFLVRSGVLTSVHAFALDPSRGVFMLGILVLALGFALLLYALRVPVIAARAGTGMGLSPVSREGVILMGNALLCCMLAVLFAGTFYPVFLGVLDAGAITVGPPYYHATLFPLAGLAALLMAVAPVLAWKGPFFTRSVSAPLGLGLACLALSASVAMLGVLPASSLAGFAFGAWSVLTALYALARAGYARTLWGMALAHAGMGVLVLGITAATAFSFESIRYMKPGDAVTVAGSRIVFETLTDVTGDNYNAEVATLKAVSGATGAAQLRPERRWWPASSMQTSESALDIGFLGVTYAVLGEAHPDDAAKRVLRIWFHPFAWLIWTGGLLMALGGLVARHSKEGA